MKKLSALAKSPVVKTVALPRRDQLKIVIVGHVDHGKSTLVGRLLHDTDSLPEGKFEQIQASCAKRGMKFEWSFLMDALQAERDQGITIDTSQIWFKSAVRDYVIIDAPGHHEFLKNMITGASSADAALLLIDAAEGVRDQSRRHGYLLHLLGIRQVAVVINKMDRVEYSEQRFNALEKECREYLGTIGVQPEFIIPISARDGDGIVQSSPQMKWYKGPSILEALEKFDGAAESSHLPLRLPIQDVYKFDDRRILAGRIESGQLKVGDTLLFSPTNRAAKVMSIEQWPEPQKPVKEAVAGQAVGITLDDQLFVERGHIASLESHAPKLMSLFRARIFWLGRKPLTAGVRYRIRLQTSEYSAEVRNIEKVVDATSLTHSKGDSVPRGAVAEVVFRIRGLAAVDDFADHPQMGRFVILDGVEVSGGGIISTEGFTDQRVEAVQVKSRNITEVDLRITEQQRALANGHLGGVLWFTGLSGAGKSTLALELQQKLFTRGYQVMVLDGDNIRRGLNADLGFAPEDRAENIRRVGEVAALFAEAGMIVITAFISPYAEDRRRARASAPEKFHTVYIKADITTCEERDTKGLYKKARAGKIKDFTGISAPYEEPENPDLIIDTAREKLAESVHNLVMYVERQLVEPVHDQLQANTDMAKDI